LQFPELSGEYGRGALALSDEEFIKTKGSQ